MVSRLSVFIVGVLLFFSSALFAAEETMLPMTLSFESFSQKVLAYYPKIKAAHSDVSIALAKKMQAQAGFWPSLDLSAGYKVTDDPVGVFGMLLRQERFTSSDFDLKRLNTPDHHQDFSAGAHVEWPLFNAMQTIDRVRSSREDLKAAESDEAFTKMEALLMAQDAYLNALILERLSSIIDQVQKGSDEDLKKAKDLKDKGMILGADYYSARVMFGDFTRMKNELDRQKKAMMTLLNILMGEPWDKVWALSDTIKEVVVSLNDSQKLAEEAFVNRADLVALNARLKAFDSELSRERSTALPSLSAFGDATNDRNKIRASGGNNYAVGLKVEMSLFDPSRSGRVREAEARKVRLEHDVQILKDAISRDITEEFARHEMFRDNMPILKEMTEDAKEAVSLMVPLYSEGRKSIADLLDVRRAYLQSAQSYNKALMGIWMSEGRLLFLTGRLSEDEMRKLAEGAGF